MITTPTMIPAPLTGAGPSSVWTWILPHDGADD